MSKVSRIQPSSALSKPAKGTSSPTAINPAGHRVAQPRQVGGDPGPAARAQPLVDADDDGGAERDHGGGSGQRDRDADEADVTAAEQVLLGPEPHDEEDHRWQQEAKQHRRGAEREGERGTQPGELRRRHLHVAFAGVVVLRLAAGGPLGHGQHQGEGQQAERELGGGGPVGHGEPAGVNAGGEGLDTEIGHGAEIGDRLHHRQQHAAGDGRARRIGRLTRQNAYQALWPRVRAARKAPELCCRKAARASR